MKNYKVIDTFIFGGELDLLKMRLDYLYNSVDYFVFSESNKTHNGVKKELTFLKNFEMFEPYRDKIKYVIFEPDITGLNLNVTPENIFNSDLWKLERGQRSVVHKKVLELSDEDTLILHSDCDEFPDKTKFDELREITKDTYLEVVSLGQPTYYYSPNNLLDINWYGTVAFNHRTLVNLKDYFSVRENRFQSKHLENAGWHFSFFSSPEQIQHKIRTYAHQEYNTPELTNIDNLKYKIYNGLDVLDRTDVKIKKLDKIHENFPIEFYRHDLFFQNTFNKVNLTNETLKRKKDSMQIPLEIENLQIKVNSKNPKIILEIGTAAGGTLARWFEIQSVEKIISIDLPEGIHGGQTHSVRDSVINDFTIQAKNSEKKFYSIDGDSKDENTMKKLSEILGEDKIDFLFIDGDHTYDGVKKDLKLYEKFLNNDSLVAFHDIIDCEFHREVDCYVSKFWNEVKNNYKHEEFVYTHLLDKVISPFFFELTSHRGGFGGIGIINYEVEKIKENISLIVPIYNNVEETIKNVTTTLNSSKHIKEVILFSNGTSDDGNIILKQFADTNEIIKLYVVKDAIGYIKAVNESLKLCTNELILCMNSDAAMYGDWEERLLLLCKDEKNGLIGPVKVRNFILGCAFIIKKSILNKVGMLNEGFGLGYEDDVEFSERIERNGYNLAYCYFKSDLGWTSNVDFPIYHTQGNSFKLINEGIINKLVDINKNKNEKLKSSTKVTVLKNLTHSEILDFIEKNNHEVIVAVINSGDNFEKIRFDNTIISEINLFECTKEMNIDEVIESITKGKNVKLIEKNSFKNHIITENQINYRFDIINALIQKNNFKKYLEIGVRNPKHCFDLIKCELKHGVDPGSEGNYNVTFNMTSDDFFSSNKIKYDLIFIDGLHLDYQVEKDIKNSLNHLSDGGIIVMHDCNPENVYLQREDYYDVSTPVSLLWTGTVWKALVKVRSEMDDIYTSVVDIDYGVGIIQKSKTPNKIINDNPYFSFNKFSKNRKYYLNLISKNEFIEKYIGKQNNKTESKKNNLTWLAKFDDFTSMGILSQEILKNLKSCEISCQEIIGKSETKNELILKSIDKDVYYDLGIMFAYPDMWPALNDYKVKVIYTGVDSTGGIPNFAQNANNADFLLTPSKKSKSRMENLGVTKPIYVFPHGIEKNKFNFKKRKKDEVFKFLYVGECSDRKGTFHLVNAFLELFKGNQNVKLIMKSNDAMVFYKGDVLRKLVDENENIVWDVSNVGHDYVEKLYDEAHAYVYPSRADTFGMTLIEAMSCGLPIISTSEPGATELIEGRYYDIRTKNVQVFNHPWMLGEWGEPNFEDIKKHMKYVYDNYNEILNSGKLEENSEYIKNNFSWDKVTGDFEKNILPKLNKKVKVITLATSFNRPRHIKNLINSMKSVRENGIENHVYIVDNTEGELKDEVINTIYNEIDDEFTLYVSDFNMGQRGALLQLLDSVNIDDYDFIQFTDQDNIMNEPISTYTNILFENPDITFVTGYMSKEHQELGWRNTKYGNLCEKRSLRAGHMVMRVKDLKDLYPIHLDGQFGQPHNSSWNAGLDWEITYWNPKSAGRKTDKNFVLCVPGGVLHKGIDSTFYEWPVEENEYTLEELERMR